MDDIIDLDEDVPDVPRKDLNRVAKKSTTEVVEVTNQYTTRRQAAMKAKAKPNTKFMENFDPDNSAREKRKISRKFGSRRIPGALYDENGVHIATDIDLCDCLNENCKGCFFSCRKCGSQKCGTECRNNRKMIYEEVEYHGYGFIVTNPCIKK